MPRDPVTFAVSFINNIARLVWEDKKWSPNRDLKCMEGAEESYAIRSLVWKQDVVPNRKPNMNPKSGDRL